MVSGKEMKVRLRKQEVVAAVLPIQEHWLPMSNLDLLLPPLDVGVFICYKKPADNDCISAATNMIGMLKKALVQALVSFYALAGEVVTNPTGEPELLCNNRGVDFVEAYADIQLEQLNLYDADNTIQGKLIPDRKQAGVMAVQVTEFQCGGLVVACTWDHRVADAYSANMFMVSWAEIAVAAAHDDNSNKKSLLSGLQPSFRRSLLNPRRPGIIDPTIDRFFIPLNMVPPPPPQPPTADGLVSRIYSVTAHEVKRLQSEASANSCKRSKLVSFSAFLWKTIAKSAAITGQQCKLGIAVDGRTRLSLSSSTTSTSAPSPNPNPMASYFGNVVSIPYGSKPADELIAQPLCWVADAVHEFLDVATTEEHFLGLIDWAEAHRPITSMAKIYSKGIDDGPAFVVSSGEWFPLSHVDFGWGKPAFWSYSFHWEGDTGYVMPMHSPKGNGDWVVYMRLLKGHLDLIEKQASHILRPFTVDFLR